MKIWVEGLLCLALAGTACAGEANVSGPDSGIVFDAASGLLRRVQGQPGGAMLGDPVMPLPITQASVASGVAVVRAGGDRPGIYIATTARAIGPMDVSAEGVLLAISDSGTVAAVYLAADRQCYIFDTRGDRTTPIRGVSMDILTGTVSAVAVSDDGTAVLAAATDGAPGTAVYVIGAESRLLFRAGGVSALRYINDRDAVLIDDATGEVLVVRETRGTAAVSRLRAAGNGVPRGLVRDGRNLIVSVAGPAAVEMYDAATGVMIASTPLPVEPTVCERLSNGIVLVADGDGGPWYLLDTSSAPRVYFVPGR